MKTKLSLLSLAVCAAFGASPAFAQSGTVNFIGTIQSAACTPSMTGGGVGSNQVNLGTAAPSSLAAVGAVANHTGIDVTVPGECFGDNFWVFFSGGDANSNFRLDTPIAGIDVQLTDGNTGNAIKAYPAGTPVPVGAPTIVDHGGSYPRTDGTAVTVVGAYGAEFYSTDTNTSKSGSLNASPGTKVNYTFVFF